MVDYIGQQFGNYQILRLLGRGSFAEVYLAEHLYLEVPAAIKVLHVEMEPDTYEQFRREAYMIAHLQHPHIVRVLDFGVQDNTPFLIMEYTSVDTLRSLHPRGVRLSLEQIVSYVKQIASALDYAHTQHVIHCDVKPDNMLLNPKQEVVLSDFGIAVVQRSRNSSAGQNQGGTPLYMAPEQIQGKPCAASDQYAVGILVYEWLCGRPPFSGTPYSVWIQHLYELPPSVCAQRLLLPTAVEDVVFKALAKDPQDRYACVQDFADALEEACDATQTLTLHTYPVIKEDTHLVASHTSVTTEQRILDSQATVHMQVQPSIVANQDVTRLMVATLWKTNRLRLLKRVYNFWITGVLEHSLQGAALIAMGLQEQSDAVVSPWQLVLQYPTASRPFPPGTHIKDIYDAANGDLLILGAPGSGKTTLLLELARNLLEQAELDEHRPLPVVFNLSTWATKQQRLVDWFVDELASKYQVPRKFGRALVDADQILPLLDGLDEVSAKERTACIEAINSYRKEHGLVPLVVCSRRTDYLALPTRLQLSTAVIVQPLTEQQIDNYLERGGEPLWALRVALHQDAELRELVRTPLMLSVLTLTYHDMPVEQLLRMPSLEARQQQVFERYVERMLTRKGIENRYTPQQIMRWLSWLAKQLVQRRQTVFYIERMQPDWLENEWSQQLYIRITVGLVFGLFGVLCLGPIDGLIFAQSPWSVAFLVFTLLCGFVSGATLGLLNGFVSRPEVEKRQNGKTRWSWKRVWGRIARGMLNGGLAGGLVGIPYGLFLYQQLGSDKLTPVLIIGVMVGLVGSLVFLLIDGFLNIQTTEIRPAETFAWSWRKMGRNCVKFLGLGLLSSLLVGLLLGLSLGLYLWVMHGMKSEVSLLLTGTLLEGLQLALPLSPFFALVSGLLGALTGGLSSDIMHERNLTTPNQGIRLSARYSMLIGSMCMIIGGSVGALLGALITGTYDPKLVLTYGLIFGVLIGLVSGLRTGGIACIQHMVLRWLFWDNNFLPWNYVRFLDYAAEHLLLRKVGGGYMFMHRLLLEYFASLDEDEAHILHHPVVGDEENA